MQDKEFSDGSGLQEYDFNTRFYDQQLGVWHDQDPVGQYASPYLAMGNNWPNGKDKNGKWFGLDHIIDSAVGFVAGFTESILAGHANFGQDLIVIVRTLSDSIGFSFFGIVNLRYIIDRSVSRTTI